MNVSKQKSLDVDGACHARSSGPKLQLSECVAIFPRSVTTLTRYGLPGKLMLL